MNGYKNVIKNLMFRRKTLIHKRMKLRKYFDANYNEIVNKSLSEEQKKQIDDFYMANYGRKIPHIFHEVYYSISGSFDVRYFPETLYIPEFERFMNDKEEFGSTIENKNFLPLVAKAAGINVPKTILNNVRNILFDGDYNVLSFEQAAEALRSAENGFIIKPAVDTCGGSGIEVFTEPDKLTDEEIRNLLDSYGTDYVIQDLVKSHESIKKLHPESLQTFRVASYIKDGKVKFFPVIMRTGAGGSKVDNVSSGGLFIGVREDGSLTDVGYDYYGKEFDRHPDTGYVFRDYKIPLFPKVYEAVDRLHRHVPQLGVVNWDFSLREDGEPVLIEANCVCGGISDMSQYTSGKGMFGDDTEEVLKWIHKMESMTYVDRVKAKEYL